MTTYRVTSQAMKEPWEGSLEELLEANEDMPECLRRRVAEMNIGEILRLDYREDIFVVERIG